MARHDEFNRDMGQYLRQRKVVEHTNPLLAARNYFKTLLNRPTRKQEEEKPLDIPPEQVQAVIQQNSVRPVNGLRKPITKTTPVARPAAVQPQPTKVNKMGWFSKRKEDEYETFETAAPAQQAIDEDVKEVLKITFKWLKMMDPETIDEIKASKDFEKYKAVLDKYGLIKK
jgi:hypothetical protein